MAKFRIQNLTFSYEEGDQCPQGDDSGCLHPTACDTPTVCVTPTATVPAGDRDSAVAMLKTALSTLQEYETKDKAEDKD